MYCARDKVRLCVLDLHDLESKPQIIVKNFVYNAMDQCRTADLIEDFVDMNVA